MTNITEIWVNAKGYEGFYMVSNLGNVKSLDRYVNCNGNSTQLKIGKPLKPFKNKKGYLIVDLTVNGSRKGTQVHRLVAMNFIENPQNKEQVNHKDGDKQNNTVSNLEWVTNAENIKHASENKLLKRPQGDEHHNSKLSESDVYKIRELSSFMKNQELADMFGVKKNNISMILTNKTWRHIL